MGALAIETESVEIQGFEVRRLLLQLWIQLGLGLLVAWGMEQSDHRNLEVHAAGLNVSPRQAHEALRWVQGEALPGCLPAGAGKEPLRGLMAALLCAAPDIFRIALLPLLARYQVREAFGPSGQVDQTFHDLRARLVEPVLARLAGTRRVRERCRKTLSRAISTAWLGRETQLGEGVVRRLSTTDLDRLALRSDVENISADLRVVAATEKDDAALRRHLHEALDEEPVEQGDRPVSREVLVRMVTEADRACHGHGLQVRLLPLGAEVPSLSVMTRAGRPCSLHRSFHGRAQCPVDRKCGRDACSVVSGPTAAWLAGLVTGSKALLPSLPSCLVPLLLPTPVVG